jgi:hypothetical protein
MFTGFFCDFAFHHHQDVNRGGNRAMSIEKSHCFQNDYKVLLVFISCSLCTFHLHLHPIFFSWFSESPQSGARSLPALHPHLQAQSFHSKDETHPHSSPFSSSLSEKRPNSAFALYYCTEKKLITTAEMPLEA